jgi:hypothetical protein
MDDSDNTFILLHLHHGCQKCRSRCCFSSSRGQVNCEVRKEYNNFLKAPQLGAVSWMVWDTSQMREALFVGL